MNYLAHAYFSLDHPEWLIGNMISDTVKGRHKYNYPAGVQEGIALHRHIDTYTDASPLVKQAMEYLKPEAGRYSGAFTDVAFDYFLANDRAFFPDDKTLNAFSKSVYATLSPYAGIGYFPPLFDRIFPYMRAQDWLYNYKFTHGIRNSFNGLTRRAKYLDPHHRSFDLFITNMNPLQEIYQEYIPMLSATVQQWAEMTRGRH